MSSSPDYSGNDVSPITRLKLSEFPEVALEERGLRIEQALSFARWQELGAVLMFFERSSMWLLGEWAAYGEKHFGESYAQGISADSGYAVETVKVAQWVAERVPAEVRRGDLSWAHHRAVGTLEPEEQERWLDKAASDGLTSHELYDLSHDRPSEAPSPAPAQEANLEEAIRAVVEGYVADEWLSELVDKIIRVLRSRGMLEAE